MATKKKTTAPVEEQPKELDQESLQTAQKAPAEQQADQEQAQAVQAAPEEPEGAQAGIDLEDTALAGLSDEIVVVDAAGGLNLREGPGRGYPVAELLEDGTLLAVLELPHGAEVPGWALVHTGERTGWVDRHFIQALEPAEEA